MKNLYQVSKGIARNIGSLARDEIKRISDETDWENNILVVASCESEALRISVLYDSGLLDGDNVFWRDSYGICIKAIEEKGE